MHRFKKTALLAAALMLTRPHRRAACDVLPYAAEAGTSSAAWPGGRAGRTGGSGPGQPVPSWLLRRALRRPPGSCRRGSSREDPGGCSTPTPILWSEHRPPEQQLYYNLRSLSLG